MEAPDASDIDAPASPDDAFPAMLTIAATTATASIPFDTALSGSAQAPLGTFAVAKDVGSVEVNAVNAPTVLYAQSSFPGLDLFEGFAVTPSSWDIYWAYRQTGARLDVYDEA